MNKETSATAPLWANPMPVPTCARHTRSGRTGDLTYGCANRKYMVSLTKLLHVLSSSSKSSHGQVNDLCHGSCHEEVFDITIVECVLRLGLDMLELLHTHVSAAHNVIVICQSAADHLISHMLMPRMAYPTLPCMCIWPMERWGVCALYVIFGGRQ